MKKINKILAGLLTATVALGGSMGVAVGIANSLKNKSTPFTPVFRMAICSDIHMASTSNPALQQKFESFFSHAYSYAEAQSYSSLDAIVVTGDLTHTNTMAQMMEFRTTVAQNLKRETAFLSVLGNHDLYSGYATGDDFSGKDVYQNIVDEEVDKHLVVKGFHLIGISNSDTSGNYNNIAWMGEQLAQAQEDDAQKPIFTFQHFHLADTVFDSASGFHSSPSSSLLDAVYKNYPQVVNFSGHSHGAGVNPRGIYQKDYTVVDAPAFQYLGTGSNDQIMSESYYNGLTLSNLSGDKIPYAEKGANCFRIVEVAEDNRVRIYTYDMNTSSLAKTSATTDGDAIMAWEIDKPTDKSTFAYTQADATAPYWNGGATANVATNGDGTATLTLPQAQEDSCTFGYTVTLSATGKEDLVYKFIDTYYLQDNGADEAFTLTGLTVGAEYSVTVTATNVWGLTTTEGLTTSFTA